MAINRAERLLDLVAALLDASRPMTRDEILREVPGYEGSAETARRNFERDKEVLRGMGIPIAVEPADPAFPEVGDGYRIRPEEYGLPDPGLTVEELAALHLAASLVRVEGGAAVEAIWKLGGAPTGDAAVDAVVAIPGNGHIERLWGAAAERREIRFQYRGAPRRVQPWRVEFRNGRWYVTGLDLDRGAMRHFRLDRVEGVIDVGEAGSFERPAGPRTRSTLSKAWEMGDDDPVAARVLVDADQAAFAERLAGSEAVVERRAGGAVVLELAVANVDQLHSFVLGFLDKAELLEPADLRDDLTARLRRMAGVG